MTTRRYLLHRFIVLGLLGATAVAPAIAQSGKGGAAMPPIIKRFVAAVNRGDTAAFLAFFPDNGIIDDWGRKFTGHAAIKGWSDKEFIGAKGTMTVKQATQAGNQIDVRAGWKSNFYTGDSRFIFVVDGNKIREMRITSDK
jgi:hypothetical protein